MFSRNRRVRLVALLIFFAVSVVLYRSNSEAVESYGEYIADEAAQRVGGGSVLRPNELDHELLKPDSVTEATRLQVAGESRTSSSAVAVAGPSRASTVSEVHETTYVRPSTTTSSPQRAGRPPTAIPPSFQTPHFIPTQDDELPYALGQGRQELDLPYQTPKVSSAIHWSKQIEHFPVSSTIHLPSGTSKPFPRIQNAEKLRKNGADEKKLELVKAAAAHAWSGYREKAWKADEVRPVSGKKNNPFNGWGATLVDSLDTLWIMDMTAEFDEAVEAVAEIDFTTSPRADIPLFEVTIRYLGGMIAAYDMAGQQQKHRILLDKAVELAEILMGSFDTPNRMPQTFYNWKPAFASQPHRASTRVVLAELGSLSLEFTRLAQMTFEPKYYDAIARITDALEAWQSNTTLPGMWPTSVDATGCQKPAQVVSSGWQPSKQQPLPDGSGKMMDAAAPMQQGPRPSLEEKNAPQISPQQKLREDVAAGQPGVGKIMAFGNPIEEGSLDSKAARNDLLNDFGSNKLQRRQLDDMKTKSKTALNSTLHQQGTRSSVSDLSGQDVCLPSGLRASSPRGKQIYTLGGMSDSTYEYLPKEFLLLGGLQKQYQIMYLDSAQTVIDNLLFKPMTVDQQDILVSGELGVMPNMSTPDESRMYIYDLRANIDHLTCFAGGMFALGGVIFDLPEHVDIGAKLTKGCVWAYNSTKTGIMPEGSQLLPCEDMTSPCPWNETRYWEILDPYADARTKVVEPLVPTTTKTTTRQTVSSTTVVIQAAMTPVEREPAADPAPAHLERRQLGEAAIDQPKPAKVATTGIVSSPAAVSIYTPPVHTPPSHEEFVRKKIEDERLPPGFVKISGRKYMLRPEAIESVFYMYRITGDQYWRDAGWDMWNAIDRYTRAPYGSSTIDDVTKAAPELVDTMESFWTAETLKYFYLLYDDPETWSLDEWVLNTEAHFFKRPPYEFSD